MRPRSLRYVLALDQGTTSSRAVLFDRDAAVVALAQREHTQYFPRPGWVEHDAREIWEAQHWSIAEVLRAAGATPADITAVGIANQRETTVLWERASGEPLAPAIVWQDRRTAPECERLAAAGAQAAVRERTGLLLDPYFSATKLAWLLDHLPRARERALRGELAFGTLDSWLVWKLTGGAAHVTDVTNASRTLLFDIHAGEWAADMLALFAIPPACLPRLLPSSLPAAAAPQALLGGHRVPVCGLAGDQQAALFGQACFAPGMAKNTYGTGCFLMLHTGGRALQSRHRLLTTPAAQWGAARSYALEGGVFTGGAVVQWLRDGLQLIRSSADIEALAAGVPDADGLYLVPAFTGLGAPHWDPHARGALFGLTRGSGRAHIARAALESIAFQSAELLAVMQADAGAQLRELRVDGGASRNDLLMQFQADLLGVPVVRPRVTETTALGAAWLAGLGAGFWSTQEELAACWHAERRFEPAMSRDRAAARMQEWAHAVRCARGYG
ncbi:MAG TPA: glycerol kinase GlpK [Steroidobacteraceae bacterium]|nr:glycerol kinase GlpK [Steroidobacteraceae bacterium]